MEILKGIEHYINCKADSFNPTLLNKYIYKSSSSSLIGSLDKNLRIDQQTKKNNEISELTAALQIFVKTLRGPITPVKCIILKFLKEIIFQKNNMLPEEMERIQNAI